MANDDQPSLPGLAPAKRPPKQGLYLAIRLDAAAANAAMAVSAGLYCAGDSIVARGNLHVSLLHLAEGDRISQATMDAASIPMLAIDSPPVMLKFDKVESISRRPGWCVMLTASQGMGALYGLQCKLMRVFTGAEWRGSFMPHVTLLYARECVDKHPIAPICWTAREFVLIHSHRGTGRQDVVMRQPLRRA